MPTPSRDVRLIEDLVSRLPLFRGVARRRIASIARAAQLTRIRRSEWLARRGEPLPGVVAVIEGMMKLALRRSDGVERVIRFVGPGETFGEASVLLGRASTVDSVALADTALAIFSPGSIRKLAASDVRFAERLATLLAERMLALLTEVEASELRPAGERLAAYLIDIAEPLGEPGRWRARLPATKTLVAARLGMKKETLSRLLHDLVTRRLIEVSRRDISILDRGRLSELARG